MRAVHRESERLPPVLKAKIRDPCLLAGETHIIEGIRSISVDENKKTNPFSKLFQCIPNASEVKQTNKVGFQEAQLFSLKTEKVERERSQSLFYV